MRFLPPLLLLLCACDNPNPTCAATEEAFEICAEDQIWECPVASDEALAEKQAISDACQETEDPTGCLLEAEFEQFDMVLKVDCAGGGQVCVEDPPGGAPSCEDPS